MTAATVARFKASRAHACASAFECAGIEVGDRAGYVPTGNGVPLVVCAACLDRVEASDQLEQTEAPDLTVPRAESGLSDRASDELTRERYGDAIEALGDDEHESTDAPTHDSTDAPTHVCTCARITKRAKFTTRPDGVVIHGNCGLPAPAKYQNPPTEEPPRDQPGPDPANPAPGGDAAAGDAVRAAREPVGATEAGARRLADAGGRAVEGDQDGGDEGGAGGDVGGDPAAPGAPVSVSDLSADGVAPRLEEAQGEGPGDLRAVGDAAHDMADGPSPVTEPGGLAAFFSQPADEDELEDVEIAYDEPHTTYPVEDLLAAFYAQPSEDDVPNTADTPEVDSFLAGLETYELADELGRRLGGKVSAVVLYVAGESHDRIVGINP